MPCPAIGASGFVPGTWLKLRHRATDLEATSLWPTTPRFFTIASATVTVNMMTCRRSSAPGAYAGTASAPHFHCDFAVDR